MCDSLSDTLGSLSTLPTTIPHVSEVQQTEEPSVRPYCSQGKNTDQGIFSLHLSMLHTPVWLSEVKGKQRQLYYKPSS